MESMLGVGTVPFATPPPLKVMSLKPRSSARMKITLGGRSPCGSASGPMAQVTGWFGATCGSRECATIARIVPRFSQAPPSARTMTATPPSSQWVSFIPCAS